jgi:hypothetical protein
MKQPSRLRVGIGNCTAESWYVCVPYRHLSWFAVRRSGICLLLCAACAPLSSCQSALSPWRICKRFAQARPHSDSDSEWIFRDSLIFVPPHRSKRVAAARTRYWALQRRQLIQIQPASKLTERSSLICAYIVNKLIVAVRDTPT